MAQVLDGKKVRDKIAKNLKSKIQHLKSKPLLAIIQVGDNPESNTYIRQKVIFGQKIGAQVNHIKLSQDISQTDLVSEIKKHNSDISVHGIIVQMPIPNSLDKNAAIGTIDPKKDVDGQTSVNLKKLIENDKSGFLPATTKGILTLLESYKIEVSGKKIVIVGRSTLVGKPTALALINKNATITIAHSKTKGLKSVTKSADILIVAAGKPNLITKDNVSLDQTVIDVGINVIGSSRSDPDAALSESDLLIRPGSEPSGRKLVGDVDYKNVSKIVKSISPVPGGVGPMTVASLFENLLSAYQNQK